MRLRLIAVGLLALFGAIAATPNAVFNISVVAAGSYTGAPTTAALETDFDTASSNTTTCFPLNDAITTQQELVGYCANSDAIHIVSNSVFAPVTSSNATPVIVTAADAYSTLFGAPTFRLNADKSVLPSGSDWTISAAVNPGAPVSTSQDIINTGNPIGGTGFELLIDSTGHFAIHAGNGAGGYNSLTSTASDISGAHSRVCFVTWNSSTKTFTLYDYDKNTNTLSTPVTKTVSAFSGGSSTIGIVYPTSGSGTASYTGYLEWVTDSAVAMSQSTIDTLITDMTGTQAPIAMQTPNPAAPKTYLASAIAHQASFDTEFNFGSNAQDERQAPWDIDDLKFMGVVNLRDSDDSATGTYYSGFCNDGIGFSQGLPLYIGSASAHTPFTKSYVQGRFDNVFNAAGCYPLHAEPANEADDTTNSDITENDPHCTGQYSGVPYWASLLVQDEYAIYSAVHDSANPKYNGILAYGAGLQNPKFDVLSLAQECYYGKHLFYADVAVQHEGIAVGGASPDGPNGFQVATINNVYLKDKNGFQGYASPGTTGAVPQVWDEWLMSYMSPYEASGNALDEPLGAHYQPRAILQMYQLGLQIPNSMDFLSDHISDTVTTVSGGNYHNGLAFTQDGITDTQGNLKPPGYAMGNMLHYLGYGDNGSRTTATQLSFNVYETGTTTIPPNLSKFAYQASNGSYWIVLDNNSDEGTKMPNLSLSHIPPAQGGTCTGATVSFANLNAPCGTVFFQGTILENPAAFRTVDISGLPTGAGAPDHVAVYQNDESCNIKRTHASTPPGTAYQSYGAPNETPFPDCYQYWPAGSLQNHIQSSFPSISNGKITGIQYNGEPLLIHIGYGQLNPVPTATPIADQSVSTPGPSGAVPAQAAAELFEVTTPAPQFGPPTGSVPTPPA